MKRIFFIIAFIFLLDFAFGQDQGIHPMRFYVDSAGKIYVNLHQPLYFKISASPKVNSKKYLLHSRATPTVVNPLYFKHEGVNIVYTPWAIDTATRRPIYPRIDVDFIVYVDGTPPVTSIKLNKPGILYRDTLYFSRGLKVYFRAKDNIAGTDSIFYSIDGQPYEYFRDSLEFDSEKVYILRYFAVDKVGNVEKPHKFVFKIDNSAPVMNFRVVGNSKGDVLSPRARIEIKARDQFTNVKKVVYSIDDEQEQVYLRPISLWGLPEGWHTLKYYAIDILGNRTPTVKYKFFLDRTAPVLLEEIVGNSYFVGYKQYLSGNSKLKLTAIDNFAGVKAVYYSFDGKTWQVYTGPIPFPKKQRVFTLRYYAVDSVGNKSDINESAAQRGGVFTTFVDLTPPSISYSFDDYYRYGDTLFIGPNSHLKISAYDKESGLKTIYYQVDNDSVREYKNPLNFTDEGNHKLTVTAQDNVNNMSFKEITFKVDTTGPHINVIFSIHPYKLTDMLVAYPKNVKLFISAWDNMVGVKDVMVSVNNGPYKPLVNALWNFSEGANVVDIIATDYLGNKSVKSVNFVIK